MVDFFGSRLAGVLPVVILVAFFVLLVLSRFSEGFFGAALLEMQRSTHKLELEDVRETYQRRNERRLHYYSSRRSPSRCTDLRS